MFDCDCGSPVRMWVYGPACSPFAASKCMFVVCLDFVQINSVSELALTANQLASDIHRLVVRTCPGPAVFGLFMELQALGDPLTCVCLHECVTVEHG